jgi:ribose transport system ATP-binding protein
VIAAPPLLEVRGATKRFPGVLALDQVDLELRRGEVVAVIGENGAGKSTLMGVLAGITALDAGVILINGRPVLIDSVHAAIEQGIALIHQELNLCDNLDVAANIYLGREPPGGAWSTAAAWSRARGRFYSASVLMLRRKPLLPRFQ